MAAKILGNELDLYAKMRAIAVAHTHVNLYQQINCFAIGYAEDLNADNLDKVSSDPYFYSKAWQDAGSPVEVVKDFPMCFAFVPRGGIENPRGGKVRESMNMDIAFLDVIERDRDAATTGAYAVRSEEQIWANTNQMGREFISELAKNVDIGGPIEVDRIPKEAMSSKYAGTMFRVPIGLVHCDDTAGTFNY